MHKESSFSYFLCKKDFSNEINCAIKQYMYVCVFCIIRSSHHKKINSLQKNNSDE